MDHFRYLAFENATSLPDETGTYRHVYGAWWLVHPEKGLCFYHDGKQRHPLVSTKRDAPQLSNWAAPYSVRQYAHVFLHIRADGTYVGM